MNEAGPRPREGALSPYLRAIQAHRVVFGLAVLLAVAAAAIWTASSQKEYSASAQILVTPLPQDNQSFLGFELVRDSGDPTRTVQTAAALIETREAAEATASQLDNGQTAQQVLDSISIQPEGESNVLDVTATADSPGEAAEIANAYAESSLDQRKSKVESQAEAEIQRLESNGETSSETERRINSLENLREHGDPTLALSQKATPSDSAVGASAVIVIGLALLAGLAIGTGAAVVLELTAHKIRDEAEAIELYPLPILARVPVLPRSARKMRAGGVWPLPPRVREPFRTITTQLRRGTGHRTVMLTSGSTGDGKTTSSINLAMTMAIGGHSTILMDTDFRKPGVRQALQIDGRTAAPFNPAKAADALIDVPGVKNLRLLAPRPADGQNEAMFEAFADRLPSMISQLSELADFIVIDTPPIGEISDALRVAPHVDDILLVVYPGSTNRANYEVMRDLLERAGDRPSGLLVIGDHTGAASTYYGYEMERRHRGAPDPPD
jgi:capsular polysaccharide biosynthesis protein